MNNDMENGDMIKEELASILEIYYNGSFAELTCDYICYYGDNSLDGSRNLFTFVS